MESMESTHSIWTPYGNHQGVVSTAIFGPYISLATVLAVSFTLFENPDLLNLHFRQQQEICGDENKVQISGWILALSNAQLKKLGNKRAETLFS